MSEHLFDKYLLEERLPTIWCAGCGNGIVLQSPTARRRRGRISRRTRLFW